MFEDFSDFIDLDFQHLVPHPERMVCNIAQPLKNANAENEKTEKRTMGGKDWMSRKKNTAAPAVRRLIQSFTREETDQTRGVRGTVIHNRIVKFVDRKELAFQLVKLSARGLQVGIHEFRRDIDLRNAGLN